MVGRNRNVGNTIGVKKTSLKERLTSKLKERITNRKSKIENIKEFKKVMNKWNSDLKQAGSKIKSVKGLEESFNTYVNLSANKRRFKIKKGYFNKELMDHVFEKFKGHLQMFYKASEVSTNTIKRLEETKKYFLEYQENFYEHLKFIGMEDWASDMFLYTQNIIKKIDRDVALQKNMSGNKRKLVENRMELAEEHARFLIYLDGYTSRLKGFA
jgi:hypothetical protein